MNHMDLMKVKERQKGLPIQFNLRDGTVVTDGLKGNVVVLDQDNEMGHAFRYASTPYPDAENKYEMISFKYSNICSVKTFTSEEEVKTFLSQLIADGTITEEYKNFIMESLVVI